MGTRAGVDGSAGEELEGDSASSSRDRNRSPCRVLFC